MCMRAVQGRGCKGQGISASFWIFVLRAGGCGGAFFFWEGLAGFGTGGHDGMVGLELELEVGRGDSAPTVDACVWTSYIRLSPEQETRCR